MSDINQDLLLNKELCDELVAASPGHCKEASLTTTKATRTTILEEAYSRVILPYENVTNAQLEYLGDSELSGIWFEIEPDAPPARYVPYDSTPNTFTYRAEKYIVIISTVTTEEMTKNVNLLRTYKTDVRQMVTDNLMRQIHVAEDAAHTARVLSCVGSETPIGSATSTTQNIAMGAALSRQTLKTAQSFLTNRKYPFSTALVNQRTANEILGWPHDEIGGPLAQEILTKGLKNSLDSFGLFGISWVATIKNELVADGEMFQYTTNDRLGHSVMLEDITVTIKKEYDMLRMRAQEQVGTSFGVTNGLQRVYFTGDWS